MDQPARAKALKRGSKSSALASHLEIGAIFKIVALLLVPLSLVASATSEIGFIALVAAWLILAYFNRARRRRQARANAAPYPEIDGVPFVLFLRPFRTPGRLIAHTRVVGYVDRLLMGDFWDLELALAYAIRRKARTVAIGDPKHSVGALKVVTDDATWKDKFHHLSAAARAVVMIPAPSESVGWEVASLLQDEERLAKTIFVMPPRPLRPGRWLGQLAGRGPGRFWRQTQEAFRQQGIELPAYNPAGAFFTLTRGGRVARIYDADGFSEDRIVSMVLEREPGKELREPRRPWWSRAPARYTPLSPASLSIAFGTALTALVFVPFWLLFATFVYELRSVPSGHMIPTLQIGDRVAVSKFAVGYSRYSLPFGVGEAILGKDLDPADNRTLPSPPRRGDIVVFKHPHHAEWVSIERVIGLPGDTVQMKQGRLVLNGRELPRKFVRNVSYLSGDFLQSAIEYSEQLPGEAKTHVIHEWSDSSSYDETPEFLVPPGNLFLMGDNRDNSEDSRAPSGHRDLLARDPDAWPYNPGILGDPGDDAIGFVPLDYIIGRADMVLFSLYECRQPAGAKVDCPEGGRIFRIP